MDRKPLVLTSIGCPDDIRKSGLPVVVRDFRYFSIAWGPYCLLKSGSSDSLVVYRSSYHTGHCIWSLEGWWFKFGTMYVQQWNRETWQNAGGRDANLWTYEIWSIFSFVPTPPNPPPPPPPKKILPMTPPPPPTCCKINPGKNKPKLNPGTCAK